jgi:hypothetical protein
MRAPYIVAALALLVIGGTRPATAQSAPDRVQISVNGGVQLSSGTFDTSTAQPVYLENAVIGTTYQIRRGIAIDGGIGIRIAGDFGVGVTVSSVMAKKDADVSATVPHPFFFNRPRTVSGTASGQRRDELATHVQAIYTLHPNGKVDVALAAGPSFFQVHQDVVTGITFSDTYPYDTATFTSASSQRVSANGTGFNAGVDVGWRLSQHAGIGGGARFSRAKVSLAMPNSTTTVSVDAGGVQLAGGLRLYF